MYIGCIYLPLKNLLTWVSLYGQTKIGRLVIKYLYGLHALFQPPYGGLEQSYRQRSGPQNGGLEQSYMQRSGPQEGGNSDPCPMCGKRFANSDQLAIHAATCNYDPSVH